MIKNKSTVLTIILMTALYHTASADRYDDLIAKWENHGITGYNSYTESMDLAWKVVPRLEALYYGYLLTGDASLMEMAATAVDYWVNSTPRNDPDGEPGFMNGDAEQPGETFRMIGAITHFIHIVRTHDDLAGLSAAADAHLAKMENGMVKKWMDKYYVNDDVQEPVMSHYPGTGTMIYPCYKEDDGCPAVNGSSDMKGMSAQHNKAADVGLAFIWLWLATGDTRYEAVVRELALNFKSKLYWQDGGRYYSWHYWDPSHGGDYSSGECGVGPIKNSDRRWIEHRSGYGSIDMQFVAECYRRGIVYCRQDIDRFVATNRDVMYNPDGDWLLNDGSVPPDGQYGGLYGALCTYDSTGFLADYSFTTWDANYTGWGGLGLPYYVYTMKLAEGVKHPSTTFDWTGPLEATAVEGLDRGTVQVTFFNEVTRTSAEDVANYKLSRGGIVTGASLGADNKTVTLTTEEQVADYEYKLTCYDVYDVYGNKTFAYGNAQPWYFTSSSLPAGTHAADDAVRNIRVSASPSPFSRTVTFTVAAFTTGSWGITVTDINGVTVAHLTGSGTWNGRDRNGNVVPAGMYLYAVDDAGIQGTVIKTQ